MELHLKFRLTRPARKGGGDRYEHGQEGDKDYMVIYIPQFISRKEGPKPEIVVTFE